jgi:hypothetical protein
VRSPCRLIVVRRDRPEIFDAIVSGIGRWPAGTAVIWDRREGERRSGVRPVVADRRRAERRAAAASMWQTHGFLLVETDRLPAEAIRLQPLTAPAPAGGLRSFAV